MITAARNQTGRSLIEQLYVGVVFGVLVAAYFVARAGLRSVLKGLVFVAASAAAYLAAMSAAFGTVFLFPPNTSMGSSDLSIPLPVFFVGGCAGAFLIFTAALVLFGSMDFSRRTFQRILQGTLAGGVLGVAGWACGWVLGRPLLHAVHALGLRPDWATFQIDAQQNVPEYFSLYVMWQTGMAAILGSIAPREAIVTPDGAYTPARAGGFAGRRPRGLVKVIAGLFLAVLLGYLGLQVSRTVKAQRGVARRMEAYKKAQAEAPSLQNLPPMAPRGWDETFVLEDIGGLFVEKPHADFQQVSGNGPRTYSYDVRYVPQKDAPFGTYQPMVRVFVDQYPNVEWARYRAKYPTTFNPALDEPTSLVPVTKFGQRIVMNTGMRYPNGDGALYFLWPSGSLVVMISYEIREVNEEFIKRYLALLPSSL